MRRRNAHGSALPISLKFAFVACQMSRGELRTRSSRLSNWSTRLISETRTLGRDVKWQASRSIASKSKIDDETLARGCSRARHRLRVIARVTKSSRAAGGIRRRSVRALLNERDFVRSFVRERDRERDMSHYPLRNLTINRIRMTARAASCARRHE